LHGDYEEMDPANADPPFDWQWVVIILLMILLFVGSCIMSGVADAADPVDVALADLKADKAVRAALKGTPAAGRGGGDVSAPSPVVIVPGRWVRGPDGLWRFQPTAAGVAAFPFSQGPQTPPGASTGTIPAPSAGVLSTRSPVPVRSEVHIGTFALPGIRGGITNNCGPLG
jgi:hypothetical protein